MGNVNATDAMGPAGRVRYRRAADAALGVLYLFGAAALAGYATFALHPELLARVPGAAAIYGPAFTFFAQVQIWLAAAALALFLTLRVGRRWLPAFAALYLISLSSELLGTRFGVPFGAYHYTDALGWKWLGHVPLVIPLSWFFMALPSYAFARALLPENAAGRILVASFVLLAWDLVLDPAMSRATAYWVWGQEGAYYGMPWLNLFGWYVTGLALMAALSLLRADRWVAVLPLRWLAAFYGANLLLPLGIAVAAGLWGAVAAAVVALGATAAAFRRVPVRRTTTAAAEAVA